jgi:hypothetical protein
VGVIGACGADHLSERKYEMKVIKADEEIKYHRPKNYSAQIKRIGNETFMEYETRMADLKFRPLLPGQRPPRKPPTPISEDVSLTARLASLTKKQRAFIEEIPYDHYERASSITSRTAWHAKRDSNDVFRALLHLGLVTRVEGTGSGRGFLYQRVDVRLVACKD